MAQERDMNMHPIDSSTYMIILTTLFYVLSVIVSQGVVGLIAAIAGVSTIALNCYRFYIDYKKNQSKKE